MASEPRVAGSPLDLIGGTPLVRLESVSRRAGAEIWGKCEFLNPTGSVKDRPARLMVERAEAEGRLRPGGTLIEGTAGNTGIGLALVAAVRGYRCVFVIPETMSPEKIQFARLLGAEVQLSPQVGWDDPRHYSQVARRLEQELDDAVYLNQFDNPANLDVHYLTTGPEIWEQTGGAVDAVVMGAGTGGTISGVGRFLKERRADVSVVLADPEGSVYRPWVESGEPRAEGCSILEGVGIGRVPGCFDRDVIDDALTVPDQDAVDEVYRLLWDEGLFVGGSSGLSVAAAVRWARDAGRGRRIVCNLCDSGARYRSTLFDADWLARHGLRRPER
ncbi:MAG: cysteine synthase A [Acidobacteriota bacterium]